MSLHYGEPQVAVGIVFAALAAAIVGIFVVVARSARNDLPYERVQPVGYRLRRYWLTVLLALGVTVIVLTFFYLPYASGSARNRTVVEVAGGQFFWSLSPHRVHAGTPLRFDVTSVDVNHGFGLYDPHGHLIGSVQAIPGYHDELDLALTIPGAYQIRCLTFCGLDHAVMEERSRSVGPGRRHGLTTTAEPDAPGVFHPRTAGTVAPPRPAERRVGLLFAVTGLTLVGLMGLLGLTMRLAQAKVIDIGPGWFYRLMTLHGAGMLTGAVFAMMGACWYVLRPQVALSLGRMLQAIR